MGRELARHGGCFRQRRNRQSAGRYVLARAIALVSPREQQRSEVEWKRRAPSSRFMLAGEAMGRGCRGLFYKLGRLAFGPRIVAHTEMDAVFDRRVIEEQKDVHGIGIGIDEDLFAEHLEGRGAFLAGVGDDVVRDFEAVDVGLVLLITAIGVADSVCGKSKKSDEQDKRGKSGPIVNTAHRPTGAIANQKPTNG